MRLFQLLSIRVLQFGFHKYTIFEFAYDFGIEIRLKIGKIG